jgi:hypothetical protein
MESWLGRYGLTAGPLAWSNGCGVGMDSQLRCWYGVTAGALVCING